MDQSALRYAKTHEWAAVEGGVATVGITAFAVEQLTEPTFLELPKVGRVVAPDEEIGIIESVKSTSPILSPVAGEVVERNEAAAADLALVHTDPFGKGWLVKVRLAPGAGVDHLMTKAQYDQQLASEGH